jgi:hypothetical protein
MKPGCCDTGSNAATAVAESAVIECAGARIAILAIMGDYDSLDKQ